MNNRCRTQWLMSIAVGLLLVSALFYKEAGQADETSWVGSALENWNQYGFTALHGKMVVNPGGYEVLTDPEVYKGHRAASLYPIFAVGKLLGWLGDGALMFHLVFTLALFFAVWFLLGQTVLAAIGAAAAALCPGYVVYPTVVDPNAMAIYMTVPYAVAVSTILSGRTLSPLRLALLAVFTVGFTELNWSTVFGHGMLFCVLLALPAVSWPRLGIYLGLAGLSVLLVAHASILDKAGGNSGSSATPGSAMQSLLGGYTWGHGGYGVGMTTGRAITRLSVVNAVSLLPLILFAACLAVKLRKPDRRMDFLAFLPLAAGMAGVMVFRNYFGHHPWMAAPMLLTGLALSLHLLARRNPPATGAGAKLSAGWMFLAGASVYALVVLGAYRVYHAGQLELTSLVRAHTPRGETIVVVENSDPQMAAQRASIAYRCDRRVVTVPNLDAPLPKFENAVVLSAHPAGQLPLVASAEKSALLSLPLVHGLTAWYADKIARRRAEDQHFGFTAGATLALYRLTPSAP